MLDHTPLPGIIRLGAALHIANDVWHSIGLVARLRWHLCDGVDWLADAITDRLFPLAAVERETARHERHWGAIDKGGKHNV